MNSNDDVKLRCFPALATDGTSIRMRVLKHKRRYCKSQGCTRIVKSQGLCQRHGAKPKKCKIEGCAKQAQGNFEGMCKSHFKSIKVFSVAPPSTIPNLMMAQTAAQSLQPGNSNLVGLQARCTASDALTAASSLVTESSIGSSIQDKAISLPFGFNQAEVASTTGSTIFQHPFVHERSNLLSENRGPVTNIIGQQIASVNETQIVSVHEQISPESLRWQKSNEKTCVDASSMSLIAHLQSGFECAKPHGWHRNEERQSRGMPAVPLHQNFDPWERDLVWMEILLLTGTSDIMFFYLAHGWGKEVGFHLTLGQSMWTQQNDLSVANVPYDQHKQNRHHENGNIATQNEWFTRPTLAGGCAGQSQDYMCSQAIKSNSWSGGHLTLGNSDKHVVRVANLTDLSDDTDRGCAVPLYYKDYAVNDSGNNIMQCAAGTGLKNQNAGNEQQRHIPERMEEEENWAAALFSYLENCCDDSGTMAMRHA